MISITLATAQGLRSVGSAADPLDGADTTTLVAAAQGGFWALVRQRELFRITPGQAAAIAALEATSGCCLLEHTGRVFLGTEDAGLYVLADHTLVRVPGFDVTPGRSQWSQPPGRRPATTWSLASDSDHLFVNVHVGGILRSSDRGATFAPTIDPNDDVHEVAVGPNRQLWAATGAKALAVSSNAGASFRYHDAGLHARYLTCVAPIDDGVLVVASSGHAAGDDALYRFDGERFERCSLGTPGALGGSIGARQLVANGRTAAIATPAGQLYVSKDAGRSWALAAEDLPDVRAIVIRS